jgi:hypothetical protein
VRKIEERYYKKDGMISNVMDKIIISKPHEQVSSGDEEDVVMSFGNIPQTLS